MAPREPLSPGPDGLGGACARLEAAVDSVAAAAGEARADSDGRTGKAVARLDRALASLDGILGTPGG